MENIYSPYSFKWENKKIKPTNNPTSPKKHTINYTPSQNIKNQKSTGWNISRIFTMAIRNLKKKNNNPNYFYIESVKIWNTYKAFKHTF